MADTDRARRPTRDEELAGITGAYKAVTSGCPGRAAYLMWKWSSLIALGVLSLYAAARIIVRAW